MLTNQVLVSPKFRMQDSILNQIGQHRNQLKVRHDHYVPFLIINGFKNQLMINSIIKNVTSLVKRPLPYVGLPKSKPMGKFEKWTVPEELKMVTVKVCNELNLLSTNANISFQNSTRIGSEASIQDIQDTSGEASMQSSTRNGSEASIQEAGTKSTLDGSENKIDELTMYWERDEYQFLIESLSLSWPSFIKHEKLVLKRNRYPLVPGYNMKMQTEDYKVDDKDEEVKLGPEMFVKQYKKWKIKNLVPKEGKVARYRSRGGKTYPVMKRMEQ